MAEERPELYGLLAEFTTPDALMDAVRRVRAAGYRDFEAYTPFPVEGLAELCGFRDRRVPWFCLVGGIVGALTGYLMQVYINLEYPINVGGRGVVADPAFLVITFELTVLGAVLFVIGGMLFCDRLPRLNYPLFEVERFHLASRDRFFLSVESRDSRFHRRETRALLEALDPVSVTEVPS